MKNKWLFNFRDVQAALGIPSSNEVDWAIGQLLRQLATVMGIKPKRLMTKKTDPDPTVPAEHCIAHYPMRMWKPALQAVRQWWRWYGRGLTLKEVRSLSRY